MPATSAASASVPTLRFPRPQGSQRLAKWISTSSPDIMQQPFVVPAAVAEDECLTDSAYELINTDGETESQDGHATESIASSLDLLARPDDVDSLTGTDHTHGDDSQDEDEDRSDCASSSADGCTDETLVGDIASTHQSAARCLRNISSPASMARDHIGSPERPYAGEDNKGDYDQTEDENVPVRVEQLVKAIDGQQDQAGHTENSLTEIVTFFLKDVKELDSGPWIRAAWVAVLAILLGFFLPVLFPTPGNNSTISGRPPLHTPHIQPPSTTTVSVPTTVTVTITSTKTIQPNVFQDIARKIVDTADEAARAVEDTCLPVLFSVAGKIREDTVTATDSIKGAAGKAAHGYSDMSHALSSVRGTVAKITGATQEKLSHHLRVAERLKEDVNFAMLQATIGSRLLWLRVCGDMTEHGRYAAKASEHLRTKNNQLMEKRVRRVQENTRKFSWDTLLRWTPAR